MVQHFQTYLQPSRRRWGLTQGELAFLIGYKTGKSISRIEAMKQVPTLNAALSCAAIFDTQPTTLFPGARYDTEELVLDRANELYLQLQGDPLKTARIKLDFPEALIARLEGNRRHDGVERTAIPLASAYEP
jgi:DNA-binding XRE family transcriptional regulator